MPVPKYDELMNPTLQALHRLGGSGTIREIEEAVAEILDISEKKLNEIHRGNRTKFSYNLAWSRSYLKRFGVLENSARGVWALTQKGLSTKRIDVATVKRHAQGLDNRKSRSEKTSGRVLAGDPDSDSSAVWREDLLNLLKTIPPDSFERLCQRVLRESGFIQVEVTGRSGDGGIDGKGVVKIGGLLSFHTVFQCKRFARSVSPSIVRDFRGAMVGRADKGLLLTTGTFSREARLEASRDGAPPIDLVDGDELVEKLKVLGLGVKVEETVAEKITIVNEWFEGL